MFALACLSLLLAHAAGDPGQAACDVWQRELSLAQSVQQYDADRFAPNLSVDAVTDANTAKPIHGIAPIRHPWAGFIAGTKLRISWYPTRVAASADGNLAYSSGPYLFQDGTPHAQPRWTIGCFATVWRRGGDHVWRVAFDGGDNGKPASGAEAAAFRKDPQDRCPDDTDAG